MPAPTHEASSVTGSLHIEAAIPNQDACQSLRSPPFSLFVVLDGHGPSGEVIAGAAADKLLHTAAKRLEAPAQPQPHHHHNRHDRHECALHAAFAAAAEHVDSLPASADSGTTATVLLHDASSCTLSLANVGDSTAVAARRGRAPRRLSVLHRARPRPRPRPLADNGSGGGVDDAEGAEQTSGGGGGGSGSPTEDEETRRVTRAGAVVRDGYVCDRDAPKMIAVTRALGDRDVRALGVIASPAVAHYDARGVDFVIVATDGLWDAHGGVSEQRAVDAVYACLDAGGGARDAVSELLALARGRCTRPIDDTTIVVVCL